MDGTNVEWTTSTGKTFDSRLPPPGTTYLGRSVGKQLWISGDESDKMKKVNAVFTVSSQGTADEEERVIGEFMSRPIKVHLCPYIHSRPLLICHPGDFQAE